ncbi:MAG: AbrB/MazE/SpoVT family DNA-binding domain-containing protein [Ruminococcus sp.]|jgi:bifunctional DNA-binding transcriptional regulator/antitoxin component of YhaV-PrlF toxin-antitoxin module|nr:AbrB/MazE/SpoVT family DNA-binding domain-containing protein [Ruminococcus sp.]
MLSEMRARSQVTMPKEIVVSLGLKDGDKFEVFEKDGMICFMPVAVYPKSYVEKLKTIADKAVGEFESGEIKGYTNMDELIADLNKNV